MGLTLQALDNGFFVFKVLFNQAVEILEAGAHADGQKENREIGDGSQFPVQPVADIQTSEDCQHQGNADAAGKSHLHRILSRFFIHSLIGSLAPAAIKVNKKMTGVHFFNR